ncbi:MAG: serine hydrolase [Cyanobacteriota bacterium]|jgi:Beta-lactamase enzyme family|nr:serine hydrolase [Cyanobacteriota bacterium]
MAFYRAEGAMQQELAELVAKLEADGRAGLGERLSLTWVRYPSSLRSWSEEGWGCPLEQAGEGAHWQGTRQRYPASVVKLVYLVATEAWIQRQWLGSTDELQRALADMVRESSNDATGYVVDLLSGTTSGVELPDGPFAEWSQQRQLVNHWLADLDWPELEGINACQKTWGDGPYGRERQSYGEGLENRNRLNTEGTARMLQAVMAGAMVSPPASLRMQALLARSLDLAQRAADPDNQVDGFLGGGLPEGAQLWSKAGWMSQARHDAAYVEVEGMAPTLLVAFSEGESCANDDSLLPEICRRLVRG